MIFSIIVGLTNGLTTNLENLSILHAPFLLDRLLAAPSSIGSPAHRSKR